MKKRYDPDYHPMMAKNLTLLGCNHQELAKHFEINLSTLYDWYKKYPELSKAVYDGGEKADAEVAAAMYKTAVGYEREEEEIKIVDNHIERVPVTKYYPPNNKAQQFILKNRHNDKWGEKLAAKLELETNGVTVNFNIPRPGNDSEPGQELDKA